MTYNKAQLLALRSRGDIAIFLSMRPHSGKHQKQVSVAITPTNGKTVQNFLSPCFFL